MNDCVECRGNGFVVYLIDGRLLPIQCPVCSGYGEHEDVCK